MAGDEYCYIFYDVNYMPYRELLLYPIANALHSSLYVLCPVFYTYNGPIIQILTTFNEIFKSTKIYRSSMCNVYKLQFYVLRY